MREFLTFIGIVLCLALAALMAGPHFVDWGQYRSEIETRIAAVVGGPVVIEGPVSVTLLPTPSISLEQLRIGAPGAGGQRAFEAERISLSVSATSLLRGDVHVTEALVDAPILRLQAAAALTPPAGGTGGVRPEQISIDALKLRDGRIVIERPGDADVVVSAFTADIEASSLAGPAKGSGSFAIGTGTRTFRFALGKIEAGRSRLKALVEDVQLALRFDADGIIGPIEGAGPGFEGMVHLSGNPHLGEDGKGMQIPLRASAKSRIARGGADFEEVSLQLGPEPQPLTLAGEAKMLFDGKPRVVATLSARSFDFDRPGPDGKPRLAVPADLLRQGVALLPETPSPDLPDLDLDLSVGGIIVGGQTIIGGRVRLNKDARGIGIALLEGELPGQTRVKLARPAGAPAGLLAGRLEVESRDPERFARWVGSTPGAVTAGLSLRATADLRPLPEGVALGDIEIERGETRLNGQGSFLLAVPARRPAPQLALKLASARLNIADIPSFSLRERPQERLDLDFDLDIEAARLVFEGNETGRLVARMRRDGPIISIERIAVTEFGGANLIASGTIGGGARRLTIKLDATKIEALTALGEKLLPGAFMTSLRQRAPQLAPALLVAAFVNDDADESYDIKADGHLAGTQVKASGKLWGRTDLSLDLDLGLDNADGALLAAQIGGRTPAGVAAGPARITLSMRGNPRNSLSTAVTGTMPGIEAQVIGNIKIFQPFAPFEGDVTIRAADLGPVATALGATHPALPRGTPGSLSGRLASNLERITIENFKADIGGQPYSGEISFNIAENGKVAGQIRTPAIDLRPVLGLAFGEPKPGASHWTSDVFGKALAPPLPGDLWIETERARLDDKTVLGTSKFVLRFDHGAASVEYAHFQLDQAWIEGDVFVRRSGASAFLSSKLKANGLRVANFGAGSAKGVAEAEFQFSGGGETPARLIAALAGGGELTVRNGEAPRFDAEALNRLLATPLDRIGPLDATNLTRRLEAELDRGSWSMPAVKTPLVVVNGVVRTGVAPVETRAARHELQASLDLKTLALDLRVTTTSSATPEDWRGAQPQFSTHWRGPITQPQRSVEVDSLVNGYLALSLMRDLQKTEIFEQDVRERAAHNRRLKAEEWMRRRQEELNRFAQAERERELREKALEEKRQLEARIAEEAREQAEREAAEAREKARQKAERDAAEAREKAQRAEEERLRAEKAAEEERQRQAKAVDDEAARVQRIQRILQQPDTTPTPAAPAPAAPRRSAAPSLQPAPPQSGVLPPPLNLNPPVAGRPRVAAPVEVRPLSAPPGL